MTVNFFLPTCQNKLNESLFGICDNNDGTKAYTDAANPERWNAIIKNPIEKNITFISIDKCIIKDNEHIGRGRCDAMLTTNEQICFVELKNQAKSWIADAIEQLESTIQFYLEANDLSNFKHKKAYACNKQHRHFQEIDNELNLRFFRQYKVRIDIQAEVIIL